MSAPTGIRRLYAVIDELDRTAPHVELEHTHYHGQKEQCPACLVGVIREAVDEYTNEPFDLDELEPPCHHPADQWAGRISSEGFESTHRGLSVCTCTAHAVQTQGYVQLVTGKPASELIPFDTATGGRDA